MYDCLDDAERLMIGRSGPLLKGQGTFQVRKVAGPFFLDWTDVFDQGIP
jgi:hypothetical protein